jgi:hypothetical protein
MSVTAFAADARFDAMKEMAVQCWPQATAPAVQIWRREHGKEEAQNWGRLGTRTGPADHSQAGWGPMSADEEPNR